MRSMGSVAAVIAASVLLSGCAAMDASHAGPGRAPVTLTLATPLAASDAPYRSYLRSFADRVAEESGRRILIDVKWELIPWTPASEEELVTRARAGDVDLALLPTRAFDHDGTSGFEGLQAPFLIDSVPLARKVTALPEVRHAMSRLTDLGLTALTIAFENLAHPAGYSTLLVAPADFHGTGIRTPSSRVEYRLMQALGARPGMSTTSPFLDDDGNPLTAADTAFSLAGGLADAPIVTANITFNAKFDVLVASTRALQRLDAADRALVDRVARELPDVDGDAKTAETASAAAFCTGGGRVVLASAADVVALVAQGEPALAELRRDSRAAALIDRITALKASLPVSSFELPTACIPDTGDAPG